ncbi:MAG TPA: ATP-binding cassette domain-containing protein, partial [Actinomycetes bacterium]|nr:ATP-binding cassette domain-containing protein [Actinomycetes bacterium]
MSGALLEIAGLTKRFGGVTAVDRLDLRVRSGETLGVIGPNGAGKSTLVGLVSGALRADAGRIALGGQEVTRLRAPARARLGIGRTHQVPRPFARMTVLENLLLGQVQGARVRAMGQARRQAMGILERTGLADVARRPAGSLPLLRLKRLELARALALRPRLLLLDEIGAGLIESELPELIELLRSLRAEVEALLVIEHVVEVIQGCSDRVAVLDWGRKLVEGTPAEVLSDPEVAAVYLGTTATAAPEAAPGPAAPAIAREGRAPATADEAAAPVGSLAAGASVASSAAGAPVGRPAREPLLRVEGAAVRYGAVRALQDVSLEVRRGEVVTLLGANGAGKTTAARAITGMVPLAAGTVWYRGERIDGRRPDQIAGRGIAHCMEGRHIFADLSVQENLELGGRGAADRAERRRRLHAVHHLFPLLAERRHLPGGLLSGGQQQMLAIGRALMAAPDFVIFDEVSLGLAPVVVDRLYQALATVNQRGVAMLVIEQNVERGLALADRAYVLEKGRVALHGPPAAIRDDPHLLALYVG